MLTGRSRPSSRSIESGGTSCQREQRGVAGEPESEELQRLDGLDADLKRVQVRARSQGASLVSDVVRQFTTTWIQAS
jgi:hypothetical protein